jgi:hypothetical protein
VYNIDSAVQNGRNDFFLKVEDTKGRCIYTGFCVVVYFVKSFLKFVFFLFFFNGSVTAYWISAPSGKWSPFNFIFNLGNRKYSGGGKSREKGGGFGKALLHFLGVKNWPTLVAMWVGALLCN